ncbi:oligosaccharide flippase family protein [Vibrio fluvialis]|nr:oligosaccharide flippase family protein [Vibrio fluvialis]
MKDIYFIVPQMKNDSLLYKIISIFLKKSIVFILAFVVMLLQARALGAETRGVLAALLVLPNLFVIIAEGGMRQASTYFLGKKIIDEKNTLATSKVFFFVSSIIATIILFLAQIYTLPDIDSNYILLSIVALPFLVINSGYRGVLLGYKKTDKFGNNLLIPKLIQTLVIVTLYILGILNLEWSLIVFILVGVVNFALGWLAVQEVAPKAPIRYFSFTTLSKMLKLGGVFGLSFFFINLNYQIGILVGKGTLESSELGNYAVTIQIAELVWQLPAAISVIFFSESMSKLQHDDKWVAIITKTTRIQTGLTLIICLIGIPLAQHLLPILIGNDYEMVYQILIPLIPGIVMMSVFKVINVDFAGRGKPWMTLTFMPFIALLNYFLSTKLSLEYGVVGLSIAVSITYSLAAILAVSAYSYMYKVNFLSFFILKKSDFKK